MKAKTLPRWIAYLALGTTILTWLLIIIGGVVHGTGSSLACPDWPTCFGTYFPEMKGGVFFEHSHRLVAASVGFLTVVVWIGLLLKGSSSLKKWSALAVALVIFQGILGGITVKYRLPPAVSTSHLATSMVFFALMAYLAFRTRRDAQAGVAPSPNFGLQKLRLLLNITAAAIFLQIVLGALVRHSGSGLACLDIPFCQGKLWPASGESLQQIQMLHRWMGVLLAILITAVGIRGARSLPAGTVPARLLKLSILLVFTQIGFGLWSVYSGLGVMEVSLHLGLGALIWIIFVYLNFLTRAPQPEAKQVLQSAHQFS